MAQRLFLLNSVHSREGCYLYIKDIEKVTENESAGVAEQLMLDFREPVEPPKRKRRTVKRGITG